ncbi:Diaminopimelate epimerase-like protein [Mycena metata]|uniref:Diaminopimelate epimerase-like protein n=1 Tax=Mycena metata TaxID=1033252 RepID=A0AAD7J4F8_9AGAR|nr:Diaminopimelate epimerase-like protein [Mycena metata]
MPPTQLAYNVFDAFTAKRFRGNPAAVIVLQPDHGLSDEILQLIGREFNLSETAFLVPLEDHREDAPHFSLRWFTPHLEAPLCGHATLAAACHLRLNYPELRPAVPLRVARIWRAQNIPVALAEAERISRPVLRTKRGYMVEVAGTVDVSSVVHDSVAIARDIKIGQCVLTGPHEPTADDDSQVHSRMFACGSGIDEDPVTGSAHTRIVPLVRESGSWIRCGFRDEGRVLLRGHGVKVAEGVLFL